MRDRCLDAGCSRTQFAPRIVAARQLVSHGHIRVNGVKCNIASRLVKPGDESSLGSKAQETIAKLIAQDKALEAEANAIANVEKLVRYHRDLYRLLNNFVNFSDFYDPEYPATFQVGTLYLDGRACDLCVKVDDGGNHAALGGLDKTYLAYVDCSRSSGEKMTVAAACTYGDSDTVVVAGNGVLCDR